MDTASQKLFLVRWVESFVFKIVLWLSGWLKNHADYRWREIVDLRENLEAPEGTPPALPALPEPFKAKSQETSAQQGFPGEGDTDTDAARPVPQWDVLGAKEGYFKGASSAPSDPNESQKKPVFLPNWAKEIQPFLANQLSGHTRRAYETDLKQFFEFMEGRIPVASLDLLKAEHVILYRKYLEEGRLSGRGKPMEKSTINRKLAVIKSFLQWLRANQVIKENPAQFVKGFPQSQESSLKGLSDEEAKRILEFPDLNRKSGALHTAILHTLLFLGLRKGELIGLKIGDLDSDRGIPVIKVRGKGHRVRVLPLTKTVKAAIDNYLNVCKRNREDKEAPLFTPTKNPRTGTMLKSMNPNAITYIVVRYAKKAGILKKISPHSCRATCISNALDKRATHRSVQHLAGWSTPLMIQRYDKRREELQNSAAFAIDYGTSPEHVAPPESGAGEAPPTTEVVGHA